MAFVPRHDALSWGRIVRTPQLVASPRFREDLFGLIAACPRDTVLPVGMRRSYGDSVLNSQGGTIEMTRIDRFMALDLATGTLQAEAGVTLSEIMRRVVPFGFFVPVTPGTRFITLGGAIANDIHGKNHHRAGTFGRHVSRLNLLRTDGTRVEIGPECNSDLFAATVGGLGLTGIIEWVEIKLQAIKSSQLEIEIVPFDSLTQFWEVAVSSNATHEHTVAWIDCAAKGRRLGRGIFSRGNWSDQGGLAIHDDHRRVRVPIDLPVHLLNHFNVRLFNYLYYLRQARKICKHRQHYASFFHPLDSIADWNRLYGRHGFWQYQCVVPISTMRDAIPALLAEIARSDQGSFLAVLKSFGDVASPGLLSFPMEGATLALDFANRGDPTMRLLSRLDLIVQEAGGRLYAAKDGRIPKDKWAAGYPNLHRFMAHVDPAIASDFWRRVSP
jgi:L-gulonolactone oxidase